jgi:hypothetical protein
LKRRSKAKKKVWVTFESEIANAYLDPWNARWGGGSPDFSSAELAAPHTPQDPSGPPR